MPQNFKKYIDKTLDARIKIQKSEYSTIISLYKELKSSRKIAKIYGVDKKIILFIVNPASKKKDEERRIRNKVWLRYYNKEKWRKAQRRFRQKKKRLGYQIFK